MPAKFRVAIWCALPCPLVLNISSLVYTVVEELVV